MTTKNKMILTPLRDAIASLDEVLKKEKDMIVRDATIQRFEYTYELAVKVLQRYFQEKSPTPINVDALTFNDLCRLAAEAELIRDPQKWFIYRDARNKTSHAYDQKLAESVYAVAITFLPDAQDLLVALQKRV